MKTISLSTVLEMPSNDLWLYVHCPECCDIQEVYLGTDDCRACGSHGPYPEKVYELLDAKRRDPGYTMLFDNIKRNGFHMPVLINMFEGRLTNGHHRIAVAEDLGLDTIPYTEDLHTGWSEEWPGSTEKQEYFDEYIENA